VRYLELGGKTGLVIPEDGYPAEYVIDIARAIREKTGAAFDDKSPEELGPQFARTAMDLVLEWHRSSMEKFGIRFDSFYRASALSATRPRSAAVRKMLAIRAWAYCT
jgi:arginyl-tRNA synthetase